jgi:uncharacterized protein with HEPN domain
VTREPSRRLDDSASLAHRYFDTSHAILRATVATDLPELDAAVARLRERVDG